jgi:hypothetical protein
MKCISCETEINPKWKHAIDINVCPSCGDPIMEEHLKNCIANLSLAMNDMLKYQAQLDDWMLSVHGYIKTDSPDLKLFLPKGSLKELRKEIDEAEFQEKRFSTAKIKVPDGKGGYTEEEVAVEKVQSDAKTESFFERAEVLKSAGKSSGKAARSPDEPELPKSVAEKTRNLRARVEEIKSSGSAAIEEGGVASVISPDMLDSASEEDVAVFSSMIDSGDIVSSGLMADPTGDDDEIPSVVLAMASRSNKRGNQGGANEKDLQSLHEMQHKVQNGHKRLSSGKGGFSRS